MGYFFHFSSLKPAPYNELYMCKLIYISYLNFKAVLILPKTACSDQTHKSISFIWIVWSTLYVYLWHKYKVLHWWLEGQLPRKSRFAPRPSSVFLSKSYCLSLHYLCCSSDFFPSCMNYIRNFCVSWLLVKHESELIEKRLTRKRIIIF